MTVGRKIDGLDGRSEDWEVGSKCAGTEGTLGRKERSAEVAVCATLMQFSRGGWFMRVQLFSFGVIRDCSLSVDDSSRL